MLQKKFDSYFTFKLISIRIIIIFSALLILLIFPAYAQIDLIGSLLVSGPYAKSQAVGNYLYAVNRWGLQIFDLTLPDTLLLLGQYATPDEAFSLTVKDNYAYIADRNDGLIILDVSDPHHPFFIGQYDTPGGTNGIALGDSLVYLADGENGMIVVDISNPKIPTFVSQFSLPEDGSGSLAMGIALQDNYIYLAAQATGVIIIDVSNPYLPQQKAIFDTDGWAHDIVLKDALAYVADRQNGLVIIDIANPNAPNFVGGFIPNQDISLGGGFTWGVAVSGSYAYITSNETRFLIGDPPPSSLSVVDVRDPRNPKFTGGYYAGGGEAVAVAIDKNYAYLALDVSGIHKIDIKNPANPVLSGLYRSIGSVNDMVVRDDVYAYVAYGHGGMVILDLSIPSRPIEIGRYSLNTFETIRSIAVYGNRAFLGSNFGKLSIIDVTSTASPNLVLDYIIPVDTLLFPFIGTMTIDSSYLYLGYTLPLTGSGCLLIFDIHQPDSPSVIAKLELETSVEKVKVKNNRVFIAAGAGGTLLLDVSNITTPTIISQIQSSNFVRDIAIENNYLYVAESEGGMTIFNITDPLNVMYAGGYGTATKAYGITVKNDTAYVANFSGEEALTILDVSDPSSPSLIGKHDTPGFAMGVIEYNRYIYVIDSYDLTIFTLKTTDVQDESKNRIPTNIPSRFFLQQNYPNPFNPTTTINYTIAKSSQVKLTVYNTLGQIVAELVNGYQAQGTYSITWDAINQPSGLYLCRFEADGFTATRKMFLQK